MRCAPPAATAAPAHSLGSVCDPAPRWRRRQHQRRSHARAWARCQARRAVPAAEGSGRVKMKAANETKEGRTIVRARDCDEGRAGLLFQDSWCDVPWRRRRDRNPETTLPSSTRRGRTSSRPCSLRRQTNTSTQVIDGTHRPPVTINRRLALTHSHFHYPSVPP
jgi:hypothetical protein